MHVAPAEHGQLPIHRLVARLAATEDRGLPLRLVSIVHRRGVPIIGLSMEGLDPTRAGERPAGGLAWQAAGQFTVTVRSTPAQLRVLRCDLEATIGILDVDIHSELDDVDVAAEVGR